MIAVGCLFPFMLALAGAIAGGTRGGAWDSAVGAGIGLLIGAAIPAIGFMVFSMARKKPNRQEGADEG